MKIIEICGPPCSGKSHLYKILTKKLKNNLVNHNQLIINYSKNFINLNFIEKIVLYLINSNKKKISIFDFKESYRKKKNIFSIFIFKIYNQICKKLFFLFIKKNKIINFHENYKIKKKIFRIQNNKINNLIRWYIEHFVKQEIAIRINSKKHVIFDEGIIQRLSMLREVEAENELIKKLVNQLSLPNFVIFIDTHTYLIKKRSERRKKYQYGYIYKNKNEIYKYKRYFLLIKKLLKKRKINMITVNHKDLKISKILKIFNKI